MDVCVKEPILNFAITDESNKSKIVLQNLCLLSWYFFIEIITLLWFFRDPVMEPLSENFSLHFHNNWNTSMDVFLGSTLQVQHLADGSRTLSPEVLALGICFLLWICVKTWLSLFNLRQWCKAHLFLETFPWRSHLECIYVLSCACAFSKT